MKSSSDCLLASSSLLISWLPRKLPKSPRHKRTEGWPFRFYLLGDFVFDAFGRYSHTHAFSSLRMRSHWVCSITQQVSHFLSHDYQKPKKSKGCTCPILTGTLFLSLGHSFHSEQILTWCDILHSFKRIVKELPEAPTLKSLAGLPWSLVAYSTLKL